MWDVFVFDAVSGRVRRMSADATGEWMEGSRGPSIDGSGDVLAFASRHPIDALDTGDDYDLFVSVKDESVGTGKNAALQSPRVGDAILGLAGRAAARAAPAQSGLNRCTRRLESLLQ